MVPWRAWATTGALLIEFMLAHNLLPVKDAMRVGL